MVGTGGLSDESTAKCRISSYRRLRSKPSPSRTNSTSLRLRAFVICRDFREQHEKNRRHDRTKFVRRGWDWMVKGSFHKSLKTLFYWSETLALPCELLKLGCDGYPGQKLPWKLVTFVYKGKPLAESPLVCSCSD